MATEPVLTPPARSSCTLYEVEATLAALASSIESAEAPEVRRELLFAIGDAVRHAREKRDRVVAFLRHCREQRRFADEEIARIERRRNQIAAVETELEDYIIAIMENFVEPDRRGIRRLEGNVSAMRLQKNPDSVIVLDAAEIPPAFKDIVVTVPAEVWDTLMSRFPDPDRHALEGLLKRCEYRPDKRAIAAELKHGRLVPGADLEPGANRVVIS